METTEENKLIATFLWGDPQCGETFDPYDRPDVWDVPDDDRGVFWSLSPYYEKTGQQIKGQLFFHSSWDWLMPVVEKIAGAGFGGGLLYGLREALIVADIEAAHKEVVEFIEWYNEQKT